MQKAVKKYLSKIGQKGGRKSRRSLSSEQAKDMVKLREARRAFKKFYSRCFWSYDQNYRIKMQDVAWVIEQLKKHGGHEAWVTAEKLCR